MRLFAAIFPPQDVAEKCGQIATAIKTFHPKAILVKPEKMHLTLRFFGDVEVARAEALVDAAVEGKSAFDVALDHVDAFPLRKQARVIFCGAQMPSPLPKLMASMGQEKPHAHLTIARLPTPRTVKYMHLSPVEFRAEKVVLVNSVLGEGGVYEIQREWDLS
ncbi:MAG: RNA 2',3'-cyclic phosphodiesterase [Fimbriimonadales bacterium]